MLDKHCLESLCFKILISTIWHDAHREIYLVQQGLSPPFGHSLQVVRPNLQLSCYLLQIDQNWNSGNLCGDLVHIELATFQSKGWTIFTWSLGSCGGRLCIHIALWIQSLLPPGPILILWGRRLAGIGMMLREILPDCTSCP